MPIAVTLAAAGGCLLVWGVLIELDIRSQLEGGWTHALRRFVVRRSSDLQAQLAIYRMWSLVCLLGGPLLVAAAYLVACWGRWPAPAAEGDAAADAAEGDDAAGAPRSRRKRAKARKGKRRRRS